MRVELVPKHVFTSRLPDGAGEFFCYLRFDPETAERQRVHHVAWRLTAAGTGDVILSGIQVVTEADQEAGCVGLAAVLPPDWYGGHLHVGQQSWHIVRFLQHGTFHLPLRGFVQVLGGHRLGEVHRTARQIASQQFGWDFLPMGPDWRLLNMPFAPTMPIDAFYGFGQPVYAPGDGRVVLAVDSYEDLPNIGQHPDPARYLQDLWLAMGNCVILEHAGDVFSVLAHLKRGSVCVKVGETVQVLQPVGALGNSGFSSGPHLHLHFMDGPDLLTASPLPVELDVEGRRYAPQSGEILDAE